LVSIVSEIALLGCETDLTRCSTRSEHALITTKLVLIWSRQVRDHLKQTSTDCCLPGEPLYLHDIILECRPTGP